MSFAFPDGELIAREIAANAPLAVQASKRMMRMGLNENFDDHVHHIYLQLLPLFKTQDMAEGMKTFMEKREPKFEGRQKGRSARAGVAIIDRLG